MNTGTNIRAKGPLGKLYPHFAFIMEGDTPSFLFLTNNGLNSYRSPKPAAGAALMATSLFSATRARTWTRRAAICRATARHGDRRGRKSLQLRSGDDLALAHRVSTKFAARGWIGRSPVQRSWQRQNPVASS
ncbi:MAG: DUF1593 domain-containing protein [Blastocatellia bacterium]